MSLLSKIFGRANNAGNSVPAPGSITMTTNPMSGPTITLPQQMPSQYNSITINLPPAGGNQNNNGSQVQNGAIPAPWYHTQQVYYNQNIALGANALAGLGTAVMFTPPGRDYVVACEYLACLIDKVYSDKPQEFRWQVKNLFNNKTLEEVENAIHYQFSGDGLDFLKDMDDQEVLNYLKLTV